MYRLIALDLDGTLLGPDGHVSGANRAAVARARQAGVEVVLATGRSWQESWDVAEEAGCSPLMVCQGGGSIADLRQKRNLRHFPMDPAAVQGVLGVLAEEELGVLAFAGDALVLNPALDAAFVDYHCPIFHRQKVVTGDMAGYLAAHGLGVNKIFAKGDPASFPAVRARLAPWGDRVYFTASGWDNLEILAPGVDKGTGIAALADMLGIPMADTVGIGDNDNDKGMFAAVGLPIAMGNAAPDIQALCAWVTGDNGHDGVARAIHAVLDGCLDTLSPPPAL